MNTQLTKDFFDACHVAKKLLRHMPILPQWMTPRTVKTIAIIHDLSLEKDSVRLSDVAQKLGITLPSVARMLATLEENGALTKEVNPSDKRAHHLVLTSYGEALYHEYVESFYDHMSEALSPLDEEKVRTVVEVIGTAQALLANDSFTITKNLEVANDNEI